MNLHFNWDMSRTSIGYLLSFPRSPPRLVSRLITHIAVLRDASINLSADLFFVAHWAGLISLEMDAVVGDETFTVPPRLIGPMHRRGLDYVKRELFPETQI